MNEAMINRVIDLDRLHFWCPHHLGKVALAYREFCLMLSAVC